MFCNLSRIIQTLRLYLYSHHFDHLKWHSLNLRIENSSQIREKFNLQKKIEINYQIIHVRDYYTQYIYIYI